MSSSSMLSRSTSSSSRICTQDTRRRISFFTSIIFLNHPIISHHTVYFFHGDKKSNLVFFWECRDFLLFLFILHCSSSRFSSDMSCSHRLLATLCLPEKVSEMQIILLISDYSIYLLENPTYADYWRYCRWTKQAEWGTTSCKYYINLVNIRSTENVRYCRQTLATEGMKVPLGSYPCASSRIFLSSLSWKMLGVC